MTINDLDDSWDPIDYVYIDKLEKQIDELLAACKAAYKDYQRVMDGRGMPSVIAMNKLEAAINLVEDKG